MPKAGVQIAKTIALCVVCIAFSSSAYAQNYERKIDVKIGAGTNINPEAFLMGASIDYRLDEYIAITSMVQWSLGSTQDMFFPHFGGRVILPRYLLSPGTKLSPIELSAVFTLGPVFRELNGFESTHIGYSTGAAVDVFLNETFSLGVTGLMNFTSNSIEDKFGSLYGQIGLHF